MKAFDVAGASSALAGVASSADAAEAKWAPPNFGSLESGMDTASLYVASSLGMVGSSAMNPLA